MVELSVGRELLAAALLTLQIATVVVVGATAGRAWSPDDRLVAWLEGVLVAIATAVAIPVGLAMLGLAFVVPMAAVHALILGAAAVAFARRERRDAADSGSSATSRPVATVLLAAFGIGIVAALGVSLALGPPSEDFDTREYHISNMAEWLQEGELWSLPYQSPAGVTSTHPGNSDMVALWLSVPSHGDELAYLAPLAFALLAILGSALLARELAIEKLDASRRAALGALAAATVVTVPLFVTTQLGSLTNDLSVAACVVAALGLVARADRAANRWTVVAAGMTVGLGIGAKYTALVPMAVVVVAALWLLRRQAWWWLVPGIVVLAAPWYLRNLLATGNPVFPQQLGPLAGGENPLEIIQTPMLDHVLPPDTSILRAAAPHAARRLGPVLALATVGAVALVWCSRQARLCRVVGAVALASLLGYLLTPYSGGGPAGLLFLIVSSFRYLIVFLLLTTVALVALAPIRWALAGVLATLGWNLIRLLDADPRFRPDVSFTGRHLALVIACGALVALACAYGGRLLDLARRWPGPALIGAGALIFVTTGLAYHRYDRGVVAEPLEHAMLTFGEEEPVVVLGVFDLRSLLGPRLERPLVGVSRGGEAGEVPFVDEPQIRRLYLDDMSGPDNGDALGRALDAALRSTDAELLVVGPQGEFSYPEGWSPDAAWCAAKRVGDITVYASTSSPLAASHCPAEAAA